MNNLDELKKAALAATPGPWFGIDEDWSDGNIQITCESRKGMIGIAKVEGGGADSGFIEPFKNEQQANAIFIALANPSALLDLIAQLEAVQKASRLYNYHQPFAWGLADKNGNAHWSECCIGDKDVMENEARNYNDYVDSEDDYITAVPLFTAAKPAGPVILPTPANYQDYGPMISLERTMAALALCGIEYTVKK
ncbi:hypothetical protein [Yersinia mollaretii]|uniref:hypothetical protein n=1 Tax=Yersinia mollaretii TaxID=33060 RepID=UPI0011A3E47D|nr:hypothetical protein [Yersinia mollaretii]